MCVVLKFDHRRLCLTACMNPKAYCLGCLKLTYSIYCLDPARFGSSFLRYRGTYLILHRSAFLLTSSIFHALIFLFFFKFFFLYFFPIKFSSCLSLALLSLTHKGEKIITYFLDSRFLLLYGMMDTGIN